MITVKKLNEFSGCEIYRDMIVVGAGANLKKYIVPILELINTKDLVTIGVNKVTEFVNLKYHLWTNNIQLHNQSGCINPSSNLMFGCGITDNLINRIGRNYTRIDYVSSHKLKPSIKDGIIYGHYRTAGLLAIKVAHILNSGLGKIYVVGMDGFTLHTEKELQHNNENQHCYGIGHTDKATYDECIKKDKLVQDGLDKLEKAGVNFSIITPTKYRNHYNKDVLGLENI